MSKRTFQKTFDAAIAVLVQELVPLKPGAALVKAVHTAATVSKSLKENDAGPAVSRAQICRTSLQSFQAELAQAAQAEHRDDPEENTTHVAAVTNAILKFAKTTKQLNAALESDLEKLTAWANATKDLDTLHRQKQMWKLFGDFAKKEHCENEYNAYEILTAGNVKKGSANFIKLQKLDLNIDEHVAQELAKIGKNSDDTHVADLLKKLRSAVALNLADPLLRAKMAAPLDSL